MEFFGRDFFQLEGFFIETAPDRGSDGGKDFLMSETIKGKVGQYKFTWLVSCKHNAKSGKAVTEKDEQNILERVKGFKADGFIGFYSTVPGPGVNNRLEQLKQNQEIKDYRIYDHRLIENIMLGVGYSQLMLRYLPNSYAKIKPLHVIFNQYEPLQCKKCGKDILMEIADPNYHANICFVEDRHTQMIKNVYTVCSGLCDRTLEKQYLKQGMGVRWNSIRDLLNTANYLRYIMATFNALRNGTSIYEDEAFNHEKQIVMKLAQKVMREMNQQDRDRFELLSSYDII